MANRKQKARILHKLLKLGAKSLAVTLPIELVQKLGWKEEQKVVVKRKGTSLVIRDWKKYSF